MPAIPYLSVSDSLDLTMLSGGIGLYGNPLQSVCLRGELAIFKCYTFCSNIPLLHPPEFVTYASKEVPTSNIDPGPVVFINSCLVLLDSWFFVPDSWAGPPGNNNHYLWDAGKKIPTKYPNIIPFSLYNNHVLILQMSTLSDFLC